MTFKENAWVHSTDETMWGYCEEFDTREDAIEAAKAEYSDWNQFYVGQVSNIDFTSAISVDGEGLLQDISEKVYYEVGEVADGYLYDVSDEQQYELEELVNMVIRGWMEKHHRLPKFFNVKNIECVNSSTDK